MNIIPAIDLIGGKCVRLTQGDYATKKIYSDDPLDMALQFEDAGLTHLHLVDLDGAQQGKPVNLGVLEQIATRTKLKIDAGGGIKTTADAEGVFNAGAQQLTAGSIAVQKPERVIEWIERFGADRIILGADCFDRKVAINGWTTGSGLDVLDFIRDYAAKGLANVVCTDISRDGTLGGPSTELYRAIIDTVAIRLIASGGVSSIADLAHLRAIGCSGAIIGKALYEGRITLQQLRALC